MDGSSCFFKALPGKGSAQKGKKAKDGKKSNQGITVAFLSVQMEERLVSQ